MVKKVQQQSYSDPDPNSETFPRLWGASGSEFSFCFIILSSPASRGTAISASPSLRREEETRLEEKLN